MNLERITILKGLLLQHNQTHMKNPSTVAMVASLEEDSFGIIRASIEHDAKAMKVYMNKVANFESAKYWSKLESDRRVYANYTMGVQAFIKRYCKIVIASTIESVLKDFLEYKREIINKPHHKMDSEHLAPRLACVVYLCLYVCVYVCMCFGVQVQVQVYVCLCVLACVCMCRWV